MTYVRHFLYLEFGRTYVEVSVHGCVKRKKQVGPRRHVGRPVMWLHSFLTSVLDRAEWSHRWHFAAGQEARCPLNRSMGGTKGRYGRICPCRKSTPVSFSPDSLVSVPTTIPGLSLLKRKLSPQMGRISGLLEALQKVY